MDNSGPFREVFRKLGIQYKEKGNRLECHCRFHDDRTPSSGVYKDTGKFFCFTCNLSLTASQFYSKATGEDEDKITANLEEQFGSLENDEEQIQHRKLRINKERLKSRIIIPRIRILGRIETGRISELLDKILFLYGKGLLAEEEIDKLLHLWYNEVEASIHKGVTDVAAESEGISGAGLDGGFQESSGNLPRDLTSRLTEIVERARSANSSRVSGTDDFGRPSQASGEVCLD